MFLAIFVGVIGYGKIHSYGFSILAFLRTDISGGTRTSHVDGRDAKTARGPLISSADFIRGRATTKSGY